MTFYTIKEAIRAGSRLKLSLPGGERIVEPHVLGRDRRGKTLLRAWQVSGPADDGAPWKVFDLALIEHAVENGGRFEHPRPGYKPNDRSMSGGIIERL
jgi:hypothetical protein